MALTIFYGWTESELLAALRRAQNDYERGTMILSAGAGDANKANQIQVAAKERIMNIQQALYELDSTTYEAFANVGANQTSYRSI